MSADAYDLDRLATAHEREAAYCEMQAKLLRERAQRHRDAASGLRAQLGAAA